MTYVTGDTHGDKTCFLTPAMKKLKKNDTLIICGDFGFVWDKTKAEQKDLKWLCKRRYKIAFVEGVHENFELLSEYPIVDIWNGKARHIGGNVYMLMKGEIYSIDGQSYMCFGGGVVDDYSDVQDDMKGVGADEEDVANARKNLDKCGWRVDYIITHDITSKLKSFILIQHEHSYLLDTFLDELYTKCRYKKWFFGCYHIDKIITPLVTGVFTKVIALNK